MFDSLFLGVHVDGRLIYDILNRARKYETHMQNLEKTIVLIAGDFQLTKLLLKFDRNSIYPMLQVINCDTGKQR